MVLKIDARIFKIDARIFDIDARIFKIDARIRIRFIKTYPSLYQLSYNSMFVPLKLQYINWKLNDFGHFTRYSG
jgi:hypothetical protein